MAIRNKKTFKLSSGFQMPAIGFGTYVEFPYFLGTHFHLADSTKFATLSDPPDPAQVENAVKTALQIGYRHIDCAPIYENEAAVGRAIKESGIPRDELFVKILSRVSSVSRIDLCVRSQASCGTRSMIQTTLDRHSIDR
jgi:L-glyceraldehyde reductase